MFENQNFSIFEMKINIENSTDFEIWWKKNCFTYLNVFLFGGGNVNIARSNAATGLVLFLTNLYVNQLCTACSLAGMVILENTVTKSS